MHGKNINVEVAESVDVMQREKNGVLGGSLIIIDYYFGSQHYWVYCKQLQPAVSPLCNIPNNVVSLSNYLLNIAS